MEERPRSGATVLIVGAGPAGLFTAQALAADNVSVIILNRDVRPGGLAEYGIFHSKHRVKTALRRQFQRILGMPNVTYYGNVTVAEDGDLALAQLRDLGFGAIVVAVGAQGTKWLGLPGEELDGVYHAKDLIYHYNELPPYSEQDHSIGQKVALIGVGNVMADIAHWLVRDLKVDEVIAVARRGPAEVKFSRQEIAHVAANFDLTDLGEEIQRVSDRMEAVDQSPEDAQALLLSALRKAPESVSETRVRFRFLSTPSRILGDEVGRVSGLEVENTALVRDGDGTTKPKRLGTYYRLDVDTVIFCIGDRVSDQLGLPVAYYSFVKHPEPRYPVDGVSYEAYDPDTCQALDGIFLVGWARKASKGQVGLARKDAIDCVSALLAYLDEKPLSTEVQDAQAALEDQLQQLNKPVVTKEEALRLFDIEAEEADARGDAGFKFATNEEMFAALEMREHQGP